MDVAPTRSNRLLLPLTLLLLAAAPVEAPPFDGQLGRAAQLVDANQPDAALAILDAMLAKAELPIEQGQVEGLRSFALARLNRIPEARKAIEAAVARAPAPSLLLLRQLFLLRTFDGDPKGAADTLLLIAASEPEGVSQLPTEVVGGVLDAVQADADRAFELDYALVTAGWSPPDQTIGALDMLRLRLIQGLIKRDRLDDARTILDGVRNPVVLVRIGIDRRLAALWPAVEARLGPGADIADAAFVAAAKARFDKAPQSLVARLGYAEALNIASREPEALAVAAAAVKTPEALAALNDRELWLVNLHAALLADAGRTDEALARYAALNATPIASHPQMIATMINAALLAESVDRADAALALAATVDAAGPYANDYGRAYAAQVRACALQLQGKRAEALAAAAPLIAKPAANDSAYLAAMLCLDRMDDAAAAVVRRLGGDDRAEMLFELQPFLIADRDKLADKRERADLRALKVRPDVKAAYLKAGRDLPAKVAPPR